MMFTGSGFEEGDDSNEDVVGIEEDEGGRNEGVGDAEHEDVIG